MTEEFIQKIKTETNESDYGRYEVGRYAWKLELIEVLEEPISAKGKLGIWNYGTKNNRDNWYLIYLYSKTKKVIVKF